MANLIGTDISTLAQRLEQIYIDEAWDQLSEAYSPEVLLDVHVPQWRFQIQGSEGAIEWFKNTTSHMKGFRVPWTRVTATESLIVLEWEVHADGDDGEHLCREVDLFHLEDGRVAHHVIFCTGMWDPATIARQRDEAPMVRW